MKMMFGLSGRLPCELSAVDSLPCELSDVDSLPCELSAAVTGAKEERSVTSERRKDVVSFIMNVFVCVLDVEVFGNCLSLPWSFSRQVDRCMRFARGGWKEANQ
jgi:hypothetical protein